MSTSSSKVYPHSTIVIATITVPSSPLVGLPCCAIGMRSLLLSLWLSSMASASAPWPQGSASQLHYLDNELSMFMHYSVCTYNNGCDGGQQNCAYQGQCQ